MRFVPLLAPLLLLMVAAPAASQDGGPASALRGHDTRAPIDVDAARIEVRDRENIALFSGNVRVRQASLALDAEQLRVFYEQAPDDNLAILRIDASGGVRLESPSERATSSYGIYDVEARTLTMIGNVVLNHGQSVLRGQRLTIDLDSGRSTLDGAGTGAAAPDAGRVTGRFVVPERRSTP